ncbi:NUDIX domain-containing protein [Bacillus coahuilensis]|uniref:NUDIX domain-containing protein n=1 Tax=Bacillus coahuilensis TaxID=408580 RepID=UPI00058E553F|nr:NUDIX domain-containing protein [Bacillus coahuilensis]
MKRRKVWMCVAGLVINEKGEWLVVKKTYGGLKGKWSIPAGFVESSETADEAAIREVREETGILTEAIGLIGMRTGIINEEISDNMVVFQLKPLSAYIQVPKKEIMDARFLHPEEFDEHQDLSVMLLEMRSSKRVLQRKIDGIDPGDVFGYTSYRLFF